MNSTQNLWNAFLAWLVTAPIIGVIFWEQKLLGFENNWGEWYETNNVYKYGVGDTIRPGWAPGIGYGKDPEGIIVEHMLDQSGRGKYVVDMTTTHQNEDGSWKRETERQIHFKWNIEHHFKCKRGNSQTIAELVPQN